jgi:CSLREA domain-containing protein
MQEALDAMHTFVVNSTGDEPDANPGDGIAEIVPGSGTCTFRAALEESNAWPGKDFVHFDISGPGPYEIEYLDPLPVISGPVVIDGTTQPGYGDEPLIVLRRDWTGPTVDGLHISGGNSIVRGLEIRAAGAGVVLSGGGENVIEENTFHCWYDAIRIEDSPDNVIGGTTPGSGNFIENNAEGIVITGLGSTRNHILGNAIVGNNHDGILIEGAPANFIGGPNPAARNIISGHSGHPSAGIRVVGQDAQGNHILGNYIGTDESGMSALANDFGIILDDAPYNVIGGVGLARNVISGNWDDGINILGANGIGNSVIGNYIGIAADGTTPLGNGDDGINIETRDNTVGGLAAGEGNVVSGNASHGIVLVGGNTTNNQILGNLVGTDKTGSLGVPNGGGIFIGNAAYGNTVGQADAVDENVIAYNSGIGVTIANGNQNRVLFNSIHSNTGLGIDLGGDGITANDDQDVDTGPNQYQNYPDLSTVSFSTGSLTIVGTISSTPYSDFLLQFFANQIADAPTGFGEGQRFIGSQTVSTEADGSADFTFTTTISTFAGQVITATATDPDGNTSEFSQSIGGTTGQLVAASNFPMEYQIHELGVPSIGNSVFVAIRNAFQGWEDIATSTIDFTDGGPTPTRFASASDGINLVTFRDDRFPFPPGVLAVVAKTLEVGEGDANASIIDADLIFNPSWIDHPQYPLGTDDMPGYFDIWSIAAHEVGHMVGLIHSGVPTSTMFPVLKTGIEVRSLETDDIAWASYLYPALDPPGSGYDDLYGSISGSITDGNIPNDPVAGALVIATHASSGASVHAYSNASGEYHVPGLPAGSYDISIQPLDGDVYGYNISPANISAYIYAVTNNFDYPDEFYSGSSDESNDEAVPEVVASVQVSVGSENSGANLMTNIDTVPPEIAASTPLDGTTDVQVTIPVIMKFSEPIDTESFRTAFSLSQATNGVTGGYTFLNSNKTAIFTPSGPLEYGIVYQIGVSTALLDAHGNPLASPWMTSFTTQSPDLVSPAMFQIDPPDGTADVFVTKVVTMTFSEALDTTSFVVGTGPGDGTFRLSAPGGAVDGTLEFNQGKTTAIFTPRRALSENTTYTVELTASITDIAGNGLDPAVTTTFTTVANAVPEVLAYGPLDGTTGASVATQAYVDFSEPMDRTSTISAASLSKTIGGALVATDVEFLYDDSRLVLRPLQPLDFSTGYTLRITTEAADLSGTPLSTQLASQFTTASTPASLTISSISPSDGIAGTEVVIAGEGFDANYLNNAVFFDAVPATVISSTPWSINAKVPLGIPAPASVDVTVTTGGQSSNAEQFTVLLPITDRTNEAVASVGADDETRDADITPDGGLAYVTNSGSDNVTVINLNTLNVVATIPVGDYPLKIAINPAGTRAYVTNALSHTVSVIDIATNTVDNTIPVGLNPVGIATTPDGMRVYVANYTSQDITVIDTDPQSGSYDQAVTQIDTEAENRDIDISPDGGLALVTGTAGLIIISIDPNATDPATGASLYNTAVARVETEDETREVDVTPDGAFAIVTTINGNIIIIDVYPNSPNFGQAVAQVNTEDESRDVDVSPDGVLIYVTNYDASSVSVFEFEYDYGPSPAGVIPDRVVSTAVSLKYVTSIIVEHSPDGIVIDDVGSRAVVANSGDGSATIVDITTTKPADAVENVIVQIEGLVSAGKLSQAHGTSLMKKLQNAFKQIAREKTKTAINVLNATINEIESLIFEGQISARNGEALISSLDRIIAMLTGPGGQGSGQSLAEEDLPEEFNLAENYPNPFNPSTTIGYDIAGREAQGVHVRLTVFNIVGQVVATLVDENQQPGRYTVTWDGTSSKGTRVASGIYLCHFSAGNFTKVQKMILMK